MSNLPSLEPTNSRPQRGVFGAKRRSEEPHGVIMTEAMRRAEVALRQIQEGPSLESVEPTESSEQRAESDKRDPAPTAPVIADERAQQLVTNISSQMLVELRSLREQIDDLMRDTNERRDMIREAIRSHAEFAESAIQHKIIIAESVAKLRSEFEGSRTPRPPVRAI
jgi:hypothetical protein